MLFGRHTKNMIKIMDKGVVNLDLFLLQLYRSTGCFIELGCNANGKPVALSTIPDNA